MQCVRGDGFMAAINLIDVRESDIPMSIKGWRCVLREHCRSAHSAASDDPTGRGHAVTQNRRSDAAAPSGAQDGGLTFRLVSAGPTRPTNADPLSR